MNISSFFYITVVLFNNLYNLYPKTIFVCTFNSILTSFRYNFCSNYLNMIFWRSDFLGLSNCKNVYSRNSTKICRVVEYTDPFLFNHISQIPRDGNVWAYHWGRLWLLICNIIPGLFIILLISILYLIHIFFIFCIPANFGRPKLWDHRKYFRLY
jgi:hypothetical protein